jgi:hypothetical protein
MAHTRNIEGPRERRDAGHNDEGGLEQRAAGGNDEDVGPEARGIGSEEGLLEAVRLGLEPHAGDAGQSLTTAEGRVRDDVLLRRLRDFICGVSVKEGWRG